MSIIQSVSYRDRSKERKNSPRFETWVSWVNGISYYPPNFLNFKRDSLVQKVSLIEYVFEVTGLKRIYCSLSRFSMSRNHYLKIFTSGFPFRVFIIIHLTRSFIRTPKYFCRDYWTGVNPMKNDQSESDSGTLCGLKIKHLTKKPKEERILETVNRVISRIQNDKRKCLWSNTLTRLA